MPLVNFAPHIFPAACTNQRTIPLFAETGLVLAAVVDLIQFGASAVGALGLKSNGAA